MTAYRRAILCLLALVAPATAEGDATVLLCEAYGHLNRFSPTGHVAIYLDRVCAESPTVLRRCHSGELGVVISRYKRIADADWLAIPLIPYLYAVESASEVPSSASLEQVGRLRRAYWESHLRALLPDAGGGPPAGNWYQLVGAAYDRRLVAFTVRTTAEQDDALIRVLNGRPNRPRFNILFRNCADFAQDVVNLYFPKAVRSSTIADLGLTTPKQVVRSLVRYARRRPELQPSAFVIPQIPGHRTPSGAAKGVLESFVKRPVYLLPLAVLQPWIPVAFGAGYLAAGRFNPLTHAAGEYGPGDLEAWARAGGPAGSDPPSPVDTSPASETSSPRRVPDPDWECAAER